jgi:hypothetical protein
VCGVYFRWSVSHALYRLACKLLALSVLASPLREEQGPSNRVRYGTPSGVITGPSLSRVVPSLQRAILSLQLTMTISQVCYVYDRRGGPGLAARRSICVRTLNGLLGHPQQSSLRPFPHKRGRKLRGLPLVTHGGSDPCQIHVWESFSKIVVVWHSHPFSSSSVLAIGASLIENLRPRSCSSVLVVRPLPWMYVQYHFQICRPK